ncbi:MAG: GNAT family N-acetyltransferase [Clostridia bacterium]|nr:GNAT family N-acetyltransferase [Clostridia bacterium]
MFDYQRYFDLYCKENGLELNLCFDMPEGYENANGMFDDGQKTVYINRKGLEDRPEFEKAFYLFHELRHAAQYLCPDRFPEMIRKSLRYVIQYNGTCFKRINDEYAACELEGGEDRFSSLYLGQPHETDANTYAFEQAGKIFGKSEGLMKLYAFWMPEKPVPDAEYEAIYSLIDERTACTLIRPAEAYAEQIQAFKEEFANCLDWLHGARGLRYSKNPEEWLRYIAEHEQNYTQYLYVRIADNKVVGMIGVQHRPDGPEETWGGHIGYCVCPSERKKGYARQMLHDVLPYCKSIGLDRVLLTAGDENTGSVKAITANGGMLESHVMSPKHHVMVGRYWIDLK